MLEIMSRHHCESERPIKKIPKCLLLSLAGWCQAEPAGATLLSMEALRLLAALDESGYFSWNPKTGRLKRKSSCGASV